MVLTSSGKSSLLVVNTEWKYWLKREALLKSSCMLKLSRWIVVELNGSWLDFVCIVVYKSGFVS